MPYADPNKMLASYHRAYSNASESDHIGVPSTGPRLERTYKLANGDRFVAAVGDKHYQVCWVELVAYYAPLDDHQGLVKMCSCGTI